MKIFSNILIIALIGLFSSTYLFNLSPIDYRETIEIETPIEKSTLSLTADKEDLLNPKSITINHVSLNEEVIKSVSDSVFTVDVYKETTLIKSGLNNLELVSPSNNMTISINKDNPMITTLDISQEKLDIEDGTYSLVFHSNLIADSKESSVTVKVSYDTGGSYYPASNVAQSGTKGLTLYFTTKNADTLIPVTRFVVEDKSITRIAIEQLQNGPINSGMKTLIGDVTNTTYNNGNVVIDIPSSYVNYNNGSTGGTLSHDTFTKTIFAVDKYWPIYSLTFTVDRKKVDTYFHGLSSEEINALPNNEKDYLLYMAYKIDSRYYLFDYKVYPEQVGIKADDTIEIKAQKMFDAYSDTDIPYGINPIPENIVLKSTHLQGNMLILDFNENLLNAYNDKNDLKHMMIDSFIYTFTSIPGVESIKITLNGDDLIDFVDGTDFTKALYPPQFINPEVVQETND